MLQFAALFLALSGVAQAHNSWLEPKTFEATPGARVPVTFYVGHHGEQHSARLAVRPSWLVSMRSSSAAGTVDLLKARSFNPAAGILVARRGTHLLALDTADFQQEMSAAEFQAYVREEGLAAAEKVWQRSRVRGRKVREAYRRHAKTLISTGPAAPADDAAATRRLGQRLEIVPAANPYRLGAGDRMPGTIWYRGAPLAGALVTLSSLDRANDEPLTARSGSDGRVSFRVPGAGRWLMNTVWSVPSARARSDFQTSFASLTFAVPARADGAHCGGAGAKSRARSMAGLPTENPCGRNVRL
jgi:uncharacterized GH25 family protein